MSLLAIIPFRSLQSGKQRLSGVLDARCRERLNRNLLCHVIAETKSSDAIDRTLLVSPDPAALDLAERAGIETLREAQADGLNGALEQAIAQASDADAVLIVAADLPFLRSSTITALLALREEPPQMIIAPDRHGDGTNLLYLEPREVIGPLFGRDSCALHVRAATKARARISYYRSAEAGVDIDAPEDWDSYAERLAQLVDSSR